MLLLVGQTHAVQYHQDRRSLVFTAGISQLTADIRASDGYSSSKHAYIFKLASFQAQRFESSDRSLHSSAIEDDAFSELGPEMSECSAKKIKLVTEKRDGLKKTYSSRRELAGVPLSSNTRPDLKEIVASIGRASPTKTYSSRRELAGVPLSSDTRPDLKEIVASIGRASPTVNSKLVGKNHASAVADDTKKISDVESPPPISIKNLPAKVGLSELVESISVFGKVSGASFVNASNGLRWCNIEFEDVDSSRKAISAGKVAVGSRVFPVKPVDAVDVVTIRIKNINKDTADFAIHSRCKSVGEFVGLARTSKDEVDVFFNVRNDKIHQNILKKLNNTVIDQNVWSAHVLPSKSKSSEVPSAKEAKYKLGLQIADQLVELKWQFYLVRNYLEDLENLHAGIMHIEEHLPSN